MTMYPQCPLPLSHYPKVLLAHGGGGTLMQSLIKDIFYEAFHNAHLSSEHDSAVVASETARLAMTCDSYVVSPRFFPGGSIGTLAVYGTVNDLAMVGALARYLTAAFILEEGLAIDELWRIACDMRIAADEAGVSIVTGDTKVVEHGKGDGIFISTSGIGSIHHPLAITPQSIEVGDAIILSGDIGRHGIAVMSIREGLQFETNIESDCACMTPAIQSLIEAKIEIHCLRDLTRGGLATSLVELSHSAGVSMTIREDAIPLTTAVRGACEMLGLDPLYVANEGRFVAIVKASDARRCLEILQQYEISKGATIIGSVEEKALYPLALKQTFGSQRILNLLSGEQLPRIC